ncbi:MAG: sulfite exporter TauE/SafE family protein [Coriobacteriales bacterium]
MSAETLLLSVAIGLVSGVLSGLFGIGGGVITTPALRLLLHAPALVAVGTPLPVILPGSISGALAYSRRNLSDVRAGLTVGAFGVPASVAGALATRAAGGKAVLIVTAVVIGYTAIDMTVLAFRGRPEEEAGVLPAEPRIPTHHTKAGLALLGILTGLYSGFLGLGGGFIVVPALVRWFGFDAKRAIGTSLVVVATLAVPGSITHFVLGNIDPALAALLTIGVVPGALIGAKITSIAREKTIRVGFALLLLGVGVVLGATEAGLW